MDRLLDNPVTGIVDVGGKFIGIPFGVQHLKLAGIALAPIGKTVVTKEVAAAARAAAATAIVAELRKGS